MIDARAALLQHKDPFDGVAGAERASPQVLVARLVAAQASGERAGSAHAPTALRVQVLGDPSRSGGVVVRQPRSVGVDDELSALRERLARRFAEELIHGRE